MLRLALGKSLCLSILLLTWGSAAHAATLYVNCGGTTGLTSIGAALKVLRYSDDHGPANINVSGACHEDVLVKDIDGLTINAVNGASITDVSNGNSVVVDVHHSRSFKLKGFTINGGFVAVGCFLDSDCLLVGNTIQGTANTGIAVLNATRAVIAGGVLQNNGFTGLYARGDVVATGVTIQNNPDHGIVVEQGGRLLLGPSSPVADEINTALPAIVSHNGVGILLNDSSQMTCDFCTITSNDEGVHLDRLASAWINGSTITGNFGFGVVIRDLSAARFDYTTSVVTGNDQSGNPPLDIACLSATAVTNNALNSVGASGHTNCTN